MCRHVAPNPHRKAPLRLRPQPDFVQCTSGGRNPGDKIASHQVDRPCDDCHDSVLGHVDKVGLRGRLPPLNHAQSRHVTHAVQGAGFRAMGMALETVDRDAGQHGEQFDQVRLRLLKQPEQHRRIVFRHIFRDSVNLRVHRTPRPDAVLEVSARVRQFMMRRPQGQVERVSDAVASLGRGGVALFIWRCERWPAEAGLGRSVGGGEDRAGLRVRAGEVTKGVVLLDQIVARILTAQFAEGVERGHDAGGVSRHGAPAPVYRPFDAKRFVAGRRHVKPLRIS